MAQSPGRSRDPIQSSIQATLDVEGEDARTAGALKVEAVLGADVAVAFRAWAQSEALCL